MPRWYKGFRCVGIKPQKLVDQIARYVQHHDVGHLVPLVRVEKRAAQGDYYAFLAIEGSEIGQVPESVQPMLNQLEQFVCWLDPPFRFGEIRDMVGAKYWVHDYVRLIPYIRPAVPPVGDPFAESDTGAEEDLTDDEIVTRTQQYDRLLTWLSATGTGSWREFQRTWQSLGGEDAPPQALRRLRLLGHIETSADRKRWAVAPPVVFPVTNGERAGQWVLCGQRDTALIQHFQRGVNVDFVPQSRGDGPVTLYLHARDPEHMAAVLRSIGRSVYQVEQPGLTLARLLPPLEGWKESLEPLQGIRPHSYLVKRFDGVAFSEVSFSGRTGLYELWPLGGHAARGADLCPEYTLYYDEVRQQWLRADWYGLRSLARYEAGQSCPVRYRSTTNQLAVPSKWRWPEVYERALVLASGRLPSYQNGWLVYESIGAELAEELWAKLRLSDEESDYA